MSYRRDSRGDGTEATSRNAEAPSRLPGPLRAAIRGDALAGFPEAEVAEDALDGQAADMQDVIACSSAVASWAN